MECRPRTALCAVAILALASAATACVSLKDDTTAATGDDDGGPSGDGGAAADGTPTSGDAAAGDAAAGDATSGDGASGDAGGNGALTIANVPDDRSAADFTVSAADDVAVDARTGLHWKITRSSGAVDFAPAQQQCLSTNAEGASDWRLPTRNELLSLIDYGSSRVSTLPSVFQDDVTAFWSEDVYVVSGQPAAAWVVDFTNPGTTTREETGASTATLARCVRGTRLPRASLKAIGGLAHDSISDRDWELVRSSAALTPANAAKRCAALQIDGKSGFRLPTIKELFSVLDETATMGPFDDLRFPSPRGALLMSQTPARGQTYPAAVDFDTAHLFHLNGSTGYVRCVR